MSVHLQKNLKILLSLSDKTFDSYATFLDFMSDFSYPASKLSTNDEQLHLFLLLSEELHAASGEPFKHCHYRSRSHVIHFLSFYKYMNSKRHANIIRLYYATLAQFELSCIVLCI